MVRPSKTRKRVLIGNADHNIDFSDLCALLVDLGFAERVRGSHHIFSMSAVAEIINLQPKGSKAKAYQVKQVRNIILKYRLGADDE